MINGVAIEKFCIREVQCASSKELVPLHILFPFWIVHVDLNYNYHVRLLAINPFLELQLQTCKYTCLPLNFPWSFNNIRNFFYINNQVV